MMGTQVAAETVAAMVEQMPHRTNRDIARTFNVHPATVGRYRKAHGIPNVQHKTAPTIISIEQQWAENTRAVEGGHVEWTGWRNACGTPTLSYKSVPTSARVVAFRMRTGREPVGYVKPDCGEAWCVASAHVDDRPGRAATAATLRAIGGAA